MVLMVALTIAIFGVLALSLDMGYTYYIRRWAQNAADSGALAAARELCIDTNPATRFTNATNAAIDYVENKNLAFGVNSQTLTNITFSPDGGLDAGEVQIDVAINHPNFVANFFGRDSTTVPATAAAGCFSPSAAFGVIPIAWRCNLIINDEGEEVCDMTFISNDDECIFTEDYMYIFFESPDKLFWCDELGEPPEVPEEVEVIHMTCGANLEIVNTAQPEHSWSWVDLDGGNGQQCSASELKGWVDNDFEGTIPTHSWIPSCSGSMTSIYGHVADLDESTIPIFDMVCHSNDAYTYCNGPEPTYPDLWHDDVDTDLPLISSVQYTFHLINFAKLRISCVDAQGSKCDQPIHARQALIDMNGDKDIKNLESIEGCFIGGFIPGLKGDPSAGVGEGAWTLYLTR